MVYLAELLVVMTDRLKIFRIQQSAISNADERMQALSASISVSRY